MKINLIGLDKELKRIADDASELIDIKIVDHGEIIEVAQIKEEGENVLEISRGKKNIIRLTNCNNKLN